MADDNEEVMLALLKHEKKTAAAAAAASADQVANAGAGSDSDSDTSESDQDSPAPRPPAASQHFDDGDDDDDDFEDVVSDLTVTVGGKSYLYTVVSQRPELVAQMTPQEKERYIEMGQKMFEDMYD